MLPRHAQESDDPSTTTSGSLEDVLHNIITASPATSVSVMPVSGGIIVCGCLQAYASLRDARRRRAATHGAMPPGPLSPLFHHTQIKTMLLALLHNFAQLPSCRLARSVRIAEGLLLVPSSSCY